MIRLLALLAFTLLAACVSPGEVNKERILIFSHTTGYRHASIEPGRAALQRLIESEGAEVVLSENPEVFSEAGLRPFSAILLLSSTTNPQDPASEWLTGGRRTALQTFVRSGRGVAAIHAAADSHYHWPWYGTLIGGRFERHPAGTPLGHLRVVDGKHEATKSLPPEVSRPDEWYYFKEFDRGSRLLVTLDPTSIGEPNSGPQPISWTREVEGGRVFYTALGHTSESYADPYFLNHVRGGLRWVLRRPN